MSRPASLSDFQDGGARVGGARDKSAHDQDLG